MNRYTPDFVCSVLNGTLKGNRNAVAAISTLLVDSRKVTDASNAVFIAINGERNNGHNYIADAYRSNVRFFIIDDSHFSTEQFRDALFCIVKNSTLALQQLAAYHRSRFQIPVIGITGSNGKTVIKEWLHQLLSADYSIVRSPKSYNSQTGVPLSVWQMQNKHQLALFEAGISKPGEMDALEKIVAPTMGVLSNIGPAHNENFISASEKLNEKLNLFRNCNTLIYPCDDVLIDQTIKNNTSLKKCTLMGWSAANNTAAIQVNISKQKNLRTNISLKHKDASYNICIPFCDNASVENAIHCASVLIAMDRLTESTANRFLHLTKVAMRLELKEGINNCTLINDSYNSDINSIKVALDFLNQQQNNSYRTVILSDIEQSGISNAELYAKVASLINENKINKFIGIGKALSEQQHLFSCESHFFTSTALFLKSDLHLKFKNETVLIKGSRSYSFEKIVHALQRKAHETVLEVDMNAMIHNLNYFKSGLKTSTAVMAMVKAYSYGTGSYEIANLLQFHRVNYLAVAYADEGIELRKEGITMPIMVMNPEIPGYAAMLQYGLEPEIFSLRVFDLFEKEIARNQYSEKAAIHLKIDTGMNRLGFDEVDIPELIKKIKVSRHIEVKSIFTHLAASDNPEKDDFTRNQLSKFERIAYTIEKGIGYTTIKHALNSSGISRFPEAQYNMVRLGIGLYGFGTNEEEQKLLQPVVALKSVISQIKKIKKGESVGYNRNWIATEECAIATIPIGYADGLNRKLSNGKVAFVVNGQKAPVIGNICMDMCMIDITGIRAEEGDEVIIFDKENPLTRISKTLQTIPYEILTGISKRVKRIYYLE